jgi:hypothetical protein
MNSTKWEDGTWEDGTLFLSELTGTFRFQEGFPNELPEIPPKSVPDSPSFPPPCDKTTAEISPTDQDKLRIQKDHIPKKPVLIETSIGR